MKRTAALTAVLLLFAAYAAAQDSKGIYKKYSDMDEVNAVYISSSMFNLIGKLPSINISESTDEINMAPLVKSLNSMFVMDCNDERVCADMKKDVDKIIDKHKMELLMEAKKQGETVRVYITGNEKTVTAFILTASSRDGFTFISLDGNMNRKELEKAIASAAESL